MSRGLEEQPLDEGELVVAAVGKCKLLLRIVLVNEVEHDRVGLPDDKVAILVVDKGRDAAVRVVLGVRGLLVLGGVEVEVDGLVGEPELFEDDSDFPGASVSRQHRRTLTWFKATYQPFGAPLFE